MRFNKILSFALVATIFFAAADQASAQRETAKANLSKVGRSTGSTNGGLGIGLKDLRQNDKVGVIVDPIRPRGGVGVIIDPIRGHERFEHGCFPTRCWVPGYFRTCCEQVYIPGCETQIWIEPIYESVCEPCGGTRQVLVTPGYFKTVLGPGHYETVTRQVWVEGFYR